MKKKTFAWLASLTLVSALFAGIAAAPHVQTLLRPAGEMFPQWAVSFSDLDDMVAGVDAVVLATVERIAPGRVAYGSGGTAPVPFTEIDLRVDRAIRGDVGSTLTVERTGGEVDGNAFYVDGDGGTYAPGEQVLLFLQRQADTGMFYLVNPQGRFELRGDRLHAVAPDDPVARRLDTKTVAEALDLIAR